MSDTRITAIMAVGAGGVIGCSASENGIPWDCPDELEHYRRTTAGAVIVMGRRTYDRLPERAFANRRAVVLSRAFAGAARGAKPALAARTPGESLDRAAAIAGDRRVFVIGGGGAIGAYLKEGLIDEFLLSRIHGSHAGDVRMDLSPLAGWREDVLRRAPDFTLCRLTPRR